MKLTLLLPTKILIDEEVEKVGAESSYGTFTILPRHIDFTTILTPGLLSFQTAGGVEEFLAVDEGVLVKCGEQIRISTGRAVYGPDLAQLRATIQAEFRALDQQERKERMALARLETDFVRRYLEMSE